MLRRNSQAQRVIHRLRRLRKYGEVLGNRNGFNCALSANFQEPGNYIWLHWSDSKNFGDDLSRILCEEISGRIAVNPSIIPNIYGRTVYSSIGSVLQWPESKHLEIWGSGFIFGHAKLLYRPQKIHSVRGPLTREILVSQGFDCPKIYGDPAAIFFKRYIHENRVKKFKIGIIAHYADQQHDQVKKLCLDDRVRLINVFDPAESIVRQSMECEIIASSSLHGLILADTLEIPNYWLKLNKNVIKDGFKFHDYFESVLRREDCFSLDSEICVNSIVRRAHLKRRSLNVDVIMESCPFRK